MRSRIGVSYMRIHMLYIVCQGESERATDSNIRNAVHDLFYTNACNEAAGQYLNAERVAHSKNQSARGAFLYVMENKAERDRNTVLPPCVHSAREKLTPMCAWINVLNSMASK